MCTDTMLALGMAWSCERRGTDENFWVECKNLVCGNEPYQRYVSGYVFLGGSGYQDHRITEWLRLNRTLKITQFQSLP